MDTPTETQAETPQPFQAAPVIPAIEEEEIETYHNPDWVFRIAMIANILSWLIAIVVIIVPGSQVFLQIQSFTAQGGELSTITPDQWYGLLADVFSTMLQGLGMAVVLQGVSHGLKLLMDIYEQGEIKK